MRRRAERLRLRLLATAKALADYRPTPAPLMLPAPIPDRTPRADLLARLIGSGNLRSYRQVIMRDPCAYCGGNGGQCDHIVPRHIAGGKTGGAMTIAEYDHVTGGCQSCNRAKGPTQSLLLFLLERPDRGPTSAAIGETTAR
jgi:hypothetical protein